MDLMSVILVIVGIGLLLGVKTMRDREKGKVDTLKFVPYVGRLTVIEGWWPKTNKDKNVIFGKIFVFVYVSIGFMCGGFIGWILLISALLPIAFHLEFLTEDGCI